MSAARERVLAELRAPGRALVLGHVRPDGDTAASALALAHVLEQLGCEVCVCLVDGLPERVAFLPEGERVVRDPRPFAPFDRAVVVDCASYARMGLPLREERLAKRIVNVDHHGTNEGYGDVDWIDDAYPAAAMMVLELADALGAKLDPVLATQLFTGIATDTGYLCYEATTPDTLRVVARLMEAGADQATLYRRLFEEVSLGHQQLVSRAVGRLRRELGDRLLWSCVSHRDGEELEVRGPLASIGVGPLCRIRGVEVAACFELCPEGNVVVELRSRGEVPVDRIARRFGGGGHPRAAGCTLAGPPEEAEIRMLEALREATVAASTAPAEPETPARDRHRSASSCEAA